MSPFFLIFSLAFVQFNLAFAVTTNTLKIRREGRSSLIPELPDEIQLEKFTHRVFDQFNDATVTLQNTTIRHLSNFHDELSYNCLNGNYTYAISWPNATLNADFNLAGHVVHIFTTLFISLNGNMTQNSCEDFNGDCVYQSQGHFDPQSTQPVQIASLAMPYYDFQVKSSVDHGTVNLKAWANVEPATQDFLVGEVDEIGSFAIAKVFNIDFLAFLNGILANTTVADLTQLSRGSCNTNSSKPQGSILPSFPAILEIEPYTHHFYGSMMGAEVNMTMESNKTAYGLDEMVNELSYNCLTHYFQLAVLIKDVKVQGPVFLSGWQASKEEGQPPIIFNATAILTSKCSQEASTPEGCLMTVHGRLAERIDAVTGIFQVNVEDSYLTPSLHSEFEIQSGYVNGEPMNEETSPLIIEKFDLFSETLGSPGQAIGDTVSDYLEQLFGSLSLTDVTTLTGGQCK